VIAFEITAALLLAAAVCWAVLGPLFGPAPTVRANPLDSLVDPLETPKGRALAALREIEFDRATGKLSDADYEELTARYSAEALQHLRAEEAAAAPADGTPTCPACGPRPESDALFCSSCGRNLAPVGTCTGCGAARAPGARFCTECGAPAPEVAAA
jgi:hypothetical protein